MAKFKSEIDLIDNGNGTYNLDYNIFSPGKKYTEGTVTKTQINTFDSVTKEIPGVKIVIQLEDGGNGNPLTLSGSIPIATPYEISESKPFVEVVYKAWDNAMQMYKERGGAIVRKIIVE
ncbi:MAG: hypothetical protein HYU67_00730 [Flavobacteriia bacterium]|nr:hypothetical protein [Flavobacteriia bacterium]